MRLTLWARTLTALYKHPVKCLDYPARERIDTRHLRVVNLALTAADGTPPSTCARRYAAHGHRRGQCPEVTVLQTWRAFF